MNLSLHIAKRIAKSSTTGYSGNIIKIAIISVSLSITIMILSTAVISGFKHEISEKIFGFWGYIHVTDTQINRSFELSPILDNSGIVDSIMSIGGLNYRERRSGSTRQKKTKGGVRAVSTFITLPGIINRESRLEGIIFKGVNQDYDWTNFDSYLVRGNFPQSPDTTPSRQILISEQTANRLLIDVGDKLVLHFVQNRNSIKRQMTVCGIYKTGLEVYDLRFAFLDMRLLQNVLEWEDNQIGGYEIFVDHIDDAIPIADYIYNEVLPPHMYAETIQEKFSSEFEWLELQDINENILLLLMIIVAIINMSTAILILILERSRMIGILKSLGHRDWDIRKVFIYCAAWIMGVSIIFGNIIGFGIAIIQKKTGFLKLEEANYYLSEVPIKFEVLPILLINIGALLVISLVMVLPTFLVTRVSPIKILRFD